MILDLSVRSGNSVFNRPNQGMAWGGLCYHGIWFNVLQSVLATSSFKSVMPYDLALV